VFPKAATNGVFKVHHPSILRLGTGSPMRRYRVKPSTARRPPECRYAIRVVVKFHDLIDIPYEDSVERLFDRLGIGPWNQLEKEFPGITLKRVFSSLPPEHIRALVARATELDRTYRPPNLLSYFVTECEAGMAPLALVKVFMGWPTVQVAYLEGVPGPPPGVNAARNPRSFNQGYLDPAPAGIDARFAWAEVDPGGSGEGIQFVDLERGWVLNHEDLQAAEIQLISGINKDYFSHGTSVLGEVVAVDNTIGNIGIAPQASAHVISEWRTGDIYNTADAILDAIAQLSFGDVLLLESQYWPAGERRPWPVEVQSAVFDSILLGATLGIVIIEVAGNGAQDLDTYTDAGGHQTLNRASVGFKDSGAIVVGAASSTVPHMRRPSSNFGSRIDCYAWGENVDTLSTDSYGQATNLYTTSFSDTSSASAIISGAALIVQSVARQKLGRRLSPGQIRAILSDPSLGTKSNCPQIDRIGLMPNLKNIIQWMLKESST
jgi:serine protease